MFRGARPKRLYLLILVSLLAAVPSPAQARSLVRVIQARLDMPEINGKQQRYKKCDPEDEDCDSRFPSQGLSVAWSGHYPLVRFLNISASPYLEAAALVTEKRSGAGIWPLAFAGSDVWLWLLGNRLMVGPHMGVGWALGGVKMVGGMGVSWCVSCSAPEDAGWFRRNVDRIELRRSGTFDPTFQDGESFPGNVERFEVSVVFRPDSK